MTYEQLVVHVDDIADEPERRRLHVLLRDHGVAMLSGAWSPAEEIQTLNAVCRLFALPAVRKEACRAADPRLPGYTGYGRARAMDTGIPNLLEMWRLSDSTKLGIPEEEARSRGHFAQAIAILRTIALHILSALELALSAPGQLAGLVKEESFELYGFHYPRELLGTDAGARRQSIHQDSSLITLLPRATHPGLYVELDGEFALLDPQPGGITVVAGTALEYVTAGHITPCTHTVDTPRSRQEGYDRTSLAFFVSAASDQVLRPLAPFRDGAAEVRYPPTHTRDFKKERYGNVYRT